MNVGVGTVAALLLFGEYLFRLLGIVSLQCGLKVVLLKMSVLTNHNGFAIVFNFLTYHTLCFLLYSVNCTGFEVLMHFDISTFCIKKTAELVSQRIPNLRGSANLNPRNVAYFKCCLHRCGKIILPIGNFLGFLILECFCLVPFIQRPVQESECKKLHKFTWSLWFPRNDVDPHRSDTGCRVESGAGIIVLVPDQEMSFLTNKSV
jgi:hypothetical protein